MSDIPDPIRQDASCATGKARATGSASVLPYDGTSEHRQSQWHSTRRHFLQWTGAAAASLAATTPGLVRAAAPAEPSPPDRPARGQSLKLGVASYTFRKFKLDKVLAMTKRAGLKYICLKSFHLPLDAKPDEIADVVKKVADAGLVLYGGGVIAMTTEAQVSQAFDYAKAAGMKVIVAGPTEAMLPRIEQKIKEYDIAVAIHNHGPGDKHFPTPEIAYGKVKNLDRRFGLCIDIGHTVRIGADLVASTEKYADRIFDIHMKDVTEATPKGRCIQCGRGVIDLPGFLRALVKAKYAGVVSYEYEIDDDDPLPGLAECVGYTKGVLAVI